MWSSREAARVLLVLLLQHLDHSDGPLIFGIRAFYQSRDPGTASRRQDQGAGHLPGPGAFQSPATGQGQRSALVSLMWLGHVPWAGRHWAPPVLTVLAPSTRYYQQRGRHKKLTDWRGRWSCSCAAGCPSGRWRW